MGAKIILMASLSMKTREKLITLGKGLFSALIIEGLLEVFKSVL